MTPASDAQRRSYDARPLRRSEYDHLVRRGMFEDEHIELQHGSLVRMSPQSTAHASAIENLTHLLVPAVLGRARVRVQLPLSVSDHSEPEPNIAIVDNVEHSVEHPRTALLVVEVADSSLGKDRAMKASLYAAAGVTEYWIVNLLDRSVEVHTDVHDGRYRDVSYHGDSQLLRPIAFPDVEVSIADMLPTESAGSPERRQ